MTKQVVLKDTAAQQWLRFAEPVQVIEARTLAEVIPALRSVEAQVGAQGLFAAGFISYEAAPAFDSALSVRQPGKWPLLWFGLYRQPEVISCPLTGQAQACAPDQWSPTVDHDEYWAAIAQIKEYIARGETYQVNYTFRLRAPFAGDAWTLFQDLARAQQADYAAYVDTGPLVLCSASPELFFRLDGRRLLSRPMKGTAARGRWAEEDQAQAEWLRHSEKNRAENVMIVDMIRNDMGRVAEIGSVSVPRLFDVERYPTVWQMTSTVRALTDAPLVEILQALFPCASITGAPKPRTMQIIAALETTPRGAYTGCIGLIAPGRQAQFNVAIRTVAIDRTTGQAEYGVGGGIVWDSAAGDEYDECRTKARVLTTRQPDFSLLETMLWSPADGYWLLELHLRRLQRSADYFGIPMDLGAVRQRLMDLAASLPAGSHKVRLLVARDGAVQVQALPFDGALLSSPVRLRLAPKPIDPADPFLYHKTTRRQLYDEARAACPDCDDVLLWNERGEITETSIANILVQLHGELITPPLTSGLLPGTCRAWLLAQRQVREQVITLDMLRRSERIYTVNSLRKQQEAVMVW